MIPNRHLRVFILLLVLSPLPAAVSAPVEPEEGAVVECSASC